MAIRLLKTEKFETFLSGGWLAKLSRVLPAVISLGFFLCGPHGLVAAAPTAAVPKLEVVLLLDSSPSTSLTDPQNKRMQASRFLVQYLQATSEAFDVNHRVGFANFGGRVGSTAPLRLVKADPSPPDAEVIQDTDFRPALHYALGEFRGAEAGPNHRMVVVLFTDGNPGFGSRDLMGKDVSRYFGGEKFPGDPNSLNLKSLVHELTQAKVDLYVVAVRPRDEAVRAWKTLLAADHFIELGDVQDTLSAYYEILAELLGFSEVDQIRMVAGQGVRRSFEPYLDEVDLFFFKEQPEVEVFLRDATGAAHPPSARGDLFDNFILRGADLPKDWRVDSRGGGGLLLLAKRPPRLVLEEPFSPRPIGSGLELLASVVRGGQRQVIDGLRITAEIEEPTGGARRIYELNPQPEGTYLLSAPALEQPGQYKVALAAQFADANAEPLRLEALLELVETPEILGVELLPGVDTTLQHKVMIRVAHAPALPWQPRVELVASTGEVLAPIRLEEVSTRMGAVTTYGGHVKLPAELKDIKIVVRARIFRPRSLQYEALFVRPVGGRMPEMGAERLQADEDWYGRNSVILLSAGLLALVFLGWRLRTSRGLGWKIFSQSKIEEARGWTRKHAPVLSKFLPKFSPVKRARVIERFRQELRSEKYDNPTIRIMFRQLLVPKKSDGKAYTDDWWEILELAFLSSRFGAAREARQAIARALNDSETDLEEFFSRVCQRGLLPYLDPPGDIPGTIAREA